MGRTRGLKHRRGPVLCLRGVRQSTPHLLCDLQNRRALTSWPSQLGPFAHPALHLADGNPPPAWSRLLLAGNGFTGGNQPRRLKDVPWAGWKSALGQEAGSLAGGPEDLDGYALGQVALEPQRVLTDLFAERRPIVLQAP